MEVVDVKYDNIVNRYFEIMSKDNPVTTEERVNDIEVLREEFFNLYKPEYNNLQLLLLGLLNDVMYMLNKEIKQTVVSLKTTEPVELKEKPSSLNELKSSTLQPLIPFPVTKSKSSSSLNKNSKFDITKFGRTVYLPSNLQEIDCSKLKIDEANLKFYPTDYLLDNKCYNLDYNIFNAAYYAETAAYNYVVEKHHKAKRDKLTSNSQETPQFFEMFHRVFEHKKKIF